MLSTFTKVDLKLNLVFCFGRFVSLFSSLLDIVAGSDLNVFESSMMSFSF